MIILSLKTYKEATGDNAIRLCQIIKKVSQETGVPIIPASQPTDIYRIKKEVGIEIWAQHIDPIDPGRNFGWLSPYSLRNAGVSGVVINHAEHPVSEDIIHNTVKKAKDYNFKTLILCPTIELAKQVEGWDPDYIGYEKGELISGPISMVDVEEKNIQYLVSILKKPLIVGAGISIGENVKKAVKLGGKGVILASAFVTATDPEAKLRELANGFKI